MLSHPLSNGYAKLVALIHLLKKEHVHITTDKYKSLPKLLSKYKSNYKIYLVDDALDVLYHATILDKNIITIWINRGRYAQMQKPIKGFKPTKEVPNIKTVREIVEAIN